MPKVGGRSFPYTKEGIADAKEYAAETGQQMSTGGKPYSPYKMKGSPMQRNFAITGLTKGSPMKIWPILAKIGAWIGEAASTAKGFVAGLKGTKAIGALTTKAATSTGALGTKAGTLAMAKGAAAGGKVAGLLGKARLVKTGVGGVTQATKAGKAVASTVGGSLVSSIGKTQEGLAGAPGGISDFASMKMGTGERVEEGEEEFANRYT